MRDPFNRHGFEKMMPLVYWMVGWVLPCLWSVDLKAAEGMERVIVAEDRKSFRTAATKKKFAPIGFNYDHDLRGRLIEDYWIDEWGLVEKDFRAMKRLGANLIRIHLQVGKFLRSPSQVDAVAIERLKRLVALSEEVGLYLDITGLGCYHKSDVPDWYDGLDEGERWQTQAFFWSEVAKACASSPAIFCYDLMNEPVVPGGKRKAGEWLGPAFAGKHFVQFITLDQSGRERSEIARVWIANLVSAIRQHDPQSMITVGLVDWSLDRPGLTSGTVPTKIVDLLDFVCVHLYPTRQLEADLETLRQFSVGKPVLIEETFPLKCSFEEFERFLQSSREHSAGFLGFYWGDVQIHDSSPLSDHISKAWLKMFEKYSQANQ